jgi:hypothetical protein
VVGNEKNWLLVVGKLRKERLLVTKETGCWLLVTANELGGSFGLARREHGSAPDAVSSVTNDQFL